MSDILRSRYSLSRAPIVGALVLVVSTLALPRAADADTITCESQNNNYRHCSAYTRGGVSLQTQLSNSGCYQGNTWGYDNRGIWVSNGCRAVFRVGSDNYRHDDKSDDAAAAVAGVALLALGAAAVHEAHERHEDERSNDHYEYNYNQQHYSQNYSHNRVDSVNCSSENGRYNHCRANVYNARVELVRQHSKSGCRHGQDWGYDRGGVWVDNGCRATFEIYH